MPLYLRSTPSHPLVDEVAVITYRYPTWKGLYLKQGCLGATEREGMVRVRFARFATMAGFARTDASLISTIVENFPHS